MLSMDIQPKQHADLNYLVVGLGVTGFSVANYLVAHGYRCRVQDTRDIPPYLNQLKSLYPQVEVINAQLDDKMISWADVLVVSPGLSIHQGEITQAVELGKSVIGDIELFAQVADKPVIAITGSNGKSTVTRLVGDMIDAVETFGLDSTNLSAISVVGISSPSSF